MIYRLGELFCGPGGLAWGAVHADIGNPDFGIVHEWANDYDENTCKTYRKNICKDRPDTVYHADIRKFDLTKLSPIDAFAFGFPCNDFSVVGEQKGIDGVYGPPYEYRGPYTPSMILVLLENRKALMEYMGLCIHTELKFSKCLSLNGFWQKMLAD